MEAQFEQIRDTQKASWNKFSQGWKKWDEMTMEFIQPTGNKIISLIHPKKDEVILDVAAGTGEPGLTIASMLDTGKVISTDLSEGMLEVAREKAAERGIKNFETKVVDASEIPFDDNTFDAISCRFGFMFFPDMQVAAKEMYRVLKDGGRLATSVWNIAEKNFWVTAIMSTISKNMEVPKPPPGAPGMFRCANPDLMEDLFKQAGFKNISIAEVEGKFNTGTADTYWNMMTEVGAPIVAALSKADNELQAKIKKEVFELIDQKFPDGKVIFDTSSLVLYAEK
ncbi:MAG TPA: class I SAM-dependent methyltransferase [Hanamia sp.]|nr:class I SAM-dependent methyltransferase [Hanamia sp.]